jgi:hypothetical protein
MTNETSTKHTVDVAPAASRGDPDDIDACACHLYDAECALHAARMSGVATWIEAASEKLHLAIANYLASVASTGGQARD